MKIAYINTFYAPDEIGGAEKSVRFLAETVVQQGHEAIVITLGRQRESTELNGVRIERLPISNLYFPTDAGHESALNKLAWHVIDSYNPVASKALGQILDQVTPDVVHTNNVGGFSVAAWRAVKSRQIPLIHTLRDYYLLCPNTAMFKEGKPCAKRCTKCEVLGTPRAIASKLVDHVVGNSQFILDKHLAYGLFPNAKRSVIYNAYQPTSIQSARIEGLCTFGFIGRLAPTKGVEILIDAAKAVQSQNLTKSFRVLIAGDGDQTYVEQLKKRAQGAPIEFLGRTKPEDLYNACDWTVLPSIWDEPLARVTFESFAHGIPVIGSKTGGTPELVIHGETGFIYEKAASPQALSEQMIQALNNPQDWPSLRITCKDRAKAFEPQKTFERYASIYSHFESFHAPSSTHQ